ncbi:MAG: hypothetical protein AABY22_16115, partial [Nanoarchaeota archaeon]
MKKKFYKKSEPQSQKKIKKGDKSRKSIYPIILTAGTLLNLCLILVVIALLILIKTADLRNVGVQESNVGFSYFSKRPDLQSFAKALIVYDLNSKVILLSKNNNLRFSPASTVKVMSALVTLENFNPATVLDVNYLKNNADSSKMGLFLGEKISVLNLIYGMLLPSGGDASFVLAQNYPGGEEKFINRMNEKAQELEMLNTYFTDPAGYNDSNYSTASDLVKLGEAALEDPLISEIIKTQDIIVFNESGTISHRLKNLNELLEIDGVNGVKTGFSNEADGVLITSFKNN